MSQSALRKSLVACAITSACMALALPAQAYDFKFDNPDWTGHLDTTLSVGAMWRVQNQDPKLAADGPYTQLEQEGIASQIDKNDSDNNFDRGLASLVYKITPALHLSWKETYGAVVSGTYFYDQRIMNGQRDGGYDPTAGCVANPLFTQPPGVPTSGYGCTQYPDNTAGDSFSDMTKRYAGRYGRMLDTYAWGNFNLGQMPLTVRAGRQVINWGEALFITGGVNTANYYDLNALMLPGSEIREALLPLDALYFNLGLTQDLTAEAFYQFDWKPDFDAPEGSYWATSDSYPGFGTGHVIIDGEAVTSSSDAVGMPGSATSAAFALYNVLNNRISGVNYDLQQDEVSLKRSADQDPKNSGQFGFALRYLAENLNSTNFSFYFTNTHAKIPVVGATVGQSNWYGSTGQTACGADASCIGALNTAHYIDTTHYFLVYPEDVQMYGLSFNTSIGKMALSGELAYRPKRYIVNEVPDNLIAELAGAAQVLSNSPSSQVSLTSHCVRTEVGGDCIPGSMISNSGGNYYFYDTVQSYTGSLVSIFTFGPTLGTDNLLALLEVGMEHLVGLNNQLHYASTASVMQIAGNPNAQEGSMLDPSHPWATYLDATSWGYRGVLQAEYNSLIPQTTFKPSIRLAQDVHGNSAVGGNFMQGRKAATLTLDFLIKNKLDVALAGTSFWGAEYVNKLGDRDNVTLAVSYSF